MELKRQLDVPDRQLADNHFIAGDEYTIADMAIWPWYGNGMLNGASYNDPRKFLQTHEYKNLTRWTKEIGERPAVKRGRMVKRAALGLPDEQTSSASGSHEAREDDAFGRAAGNLRFSCSRCQQAETKVQEQRAAWALGSLICECREATRPC
jgi:GST-like protein